MEEHDPTCSPRLRAAANAFAVELRDGAAEGGPFSVRDSFGYVFRGLFQPEGQLEPFIARCKVLALKPDVSAKTIEAESGLYVRAIRASFLRLFRRGCG